MACIRLIEFLLLLLLLLLHQVCSEEPEPVFRPEGSVVEMGYCFGVDYIVVYRSAPEGEQLVRNSSDMNMPNTPPTDLQGRTRVNEDQHLLGLQIRNLTHLDSGIYRRECWRNRTLVNQHTQQLSVCKEEIDSEEFIVQEEDGGAHLQCNSPFIGLEGTSVRWYYEMYPSYKLTLILDSSVSLKPLVHDLPGVVEVRNAGTLLVLDNSVIRNNQHFYCLVMKGMNCLSFQNMFPPDQSESREIFASQGDKVILNCPADGDKQQWETPLGNISGSSMERDQMYISVGDKSEDFSLVIPVVTDKHSGEYSCISHLLEMHYSLVLCAKKESQEKAVDKGGSVSLRCNVNHDTNQRVQWHRHNISGGYDLLRDSKDETVAIPEDLRGRLTVSENDALMTISDLEVKDEGVYWCVTLKSEFIEDNGDYTDDYDYVESEEDDNVEDSFWPDTQRCISKEETILTILPRTGRSRNLAPGPVTPGSNATPGPQADSNVTAYAVGAGLVGLLVVGAIVAGIVVKKRARASPTQRGEASQTRRDIQMGVDPGCTEKLNPNDNVA